MLTATLCRMCSRAVLLQRTAASVSQLRRHNTGKRDAGLPLTSRTSSDSASGKDARNAISKLPLTQPIPGFSKISGMKRADLEPFNTKLTTLDNGLRIATEEHYGMYCTVGIAINAGSRFEAEYPLGVSHFIEKLAFSGTPSYSNKEEMFALLEQSGALIDCQTTKDTFIYASSCRTDKFADVFKLIADAAQKPLIKSEDLEDVRMIIDFENKDMSSKPECEPLLTDYIHTAAYNGNTFGFSKYCLEENIARIDREHIYSFMKQYFTPDRIVVAGVGVNHDALVEQATELFDPSRTAWAEDSSLLLESLPPVDDSYAQYVGGAELVEKDLSKMALGPSPYPNLAHFVLGFESSSYRDEDFVPFCVLQSLMGGGGSFSAGGPGKGMYTRLYVDVLNKQHWMYNCTAYNHAYFDTGLFHIQSSCDPLHLNDMVRVILQQMLRLSEGVEKEELARAKTQLKSHLMMNLEVRPVQFEDMARQVLGHGYRKKPIEYVEQIDAVTNDDMVRIANRMLSTRPSVVGYGDLKFLPQYDEISAVIVKRSLAALKSPGYFPFAFLRKD